MDVEHDERARARVRRDEAYQHRIRTWRRAAVVVVWLLAVGPPLYAFGDGRAPLGMVAWLGIGGCAAIVLTLTYRRRYS